MSSTEFANLQDFWKQGTDNVARPLFENEAPTYNAFRKYTKTQPVSGKGWKLPLWTQRPGGHTSFLPSASDFNAATPPQSQAMYVYATHYALPIQLTGQLIRSFKTGGADTIVEMGGMLETYARTATKHINYFVQGDGTGALAYSASTLASTGAGQSMNLSTTAHATVAGQTKGGVRLDQGSYYQAYNTSTGNPRGTILVTTQGASTVTVTVLSGSVTSGDPICDVGGYQRAMRGFAWTISDVSRDLQGLSTSQFPDLNSPFTDLNGAALTPSAIENLKASLQTRQNMQDAGMQLIAAITPGQYSVLRKQGYNFRMDTTNGKDAVRGIANRYEDGDTVFVLDADVDDDRLYMYKPNQMAMFEEMPFGNYDLDGMDMRMQLGVNSTGSDNYQRAYGICANMGIEYPRTCAGLNRAKISNVVTQVNSY